MVASDASPLLANARLLKTPFELTALRAAGGIAQSAWEAMLPQIRPEMPLTAIAGLLAAEFARNGGDYNFPGHIELRNVTDPGSDQLAAGEVLWCDFGVTVEGYHSDMSRRAVLGRPSATQSADHEAGLSLLLTLSGELKPGNSVADALHRMLKLRESLHHGEGPTGRFGHGIGLSAAELPSLDARSNECLQARMVVTPEPSFTTAAGEFVHVEEMVLIGEDGPDPLTSGAATLYEAG